MTSRDFCYWLQGFFEIAGAYTKTSATSEVPMELNSDRVEIIKRHLALVFKHEIDPSFGGPAKQKELNEIHKPKIGGGDPATGLMRC